MNAFETATDTSWPEFANQVINVRNLRFGSNLTRVRVKASLFHSYLLSVMDSQVSQEWMSAVLPSPFAMPSARPRLVQCLTLLLTTLPMEDWPLLHRWLSHMVQGLPAEFTDFGKMAVSGLKHVISKAPDELFRTLNSGLTKEFCCDPRHNMQALATETECNISTVESLANKATVWIWRTLSHFYRQSAMTVEKQGGKCSVDSMTVLEVSDAVTTGLIAKNAVMHKSVLYLTPVLQCLHEVIISLSSNTQISLSNEEWGCLTGALRWKDRLFELCSQVVKKSSFHLFLPELALHWQWIVDELLHKMPHTWNELVSTELKDLVGALQSIFDRQFGPLDKLAIDMRSRTSPAPFISPFSSDAHSRLVSISSVLSPVPGNKKINIFLASVEGREICQHLIGFAREVETINSSTAEILDERLHTIEAKLRKKCFSSQFTHDSVKASVLSLMVQTWPLHDYIALNTLQTGKELFVSSAHVQSVVARAPGIYKEMVACLSGPAFRHSSVINVHNYLALRKCTASHYTKLYANYSVETSKEDMEERIEVLKDVYSHPSSCQLTYILSAGCNKWDIKSESIMEEVVAGVHIEKLGQLRSVQSTLWNNWSALCNPEMTYEASFTKTVITYVTSSLGFLASAFGITSECSIGPCDLEAAWTVASQIANLENSCLSENMRTHLLEIGKLSKELHVFSGALEEKALIAAHIALLLGLFQTSFIGRMEPVDPAKRNSLLLDYYDDELQDLESYITFSGWFDHLRGGCSLASTSLCHPHLPIVSAKCALLKAEVAQLSQQIAVRPVPPTYHLLLQDIQHFFSTVFVAKKIEAIIADLQQIRKSKKVPLDVRGKLERMLYSCDTFVEKIVQTYPLYRDLTYPLLQTVTLTCEALLLCVARADTEALDAKCHVADLGESLARYSAFPPYREPKNPLAFLNEKSCITEAVSVLLPEEKYSGLSRTIQNITMRATVLDLVTVILSHNYLNSNTIDLVRHLFEHVVTIWRQQEEEKALKMQEEESLYKYKPRTVAASETEEEQQEREFKEAFPAYYHEFDDLDGPDSNEPKEDIEDREAENAKEIPSGRLTDEQMFEMSEWHRIIYCTQVNNLWLCGSDNKINVPSQIVTAAMLRCYIMKLIIGNAGAVVGSSLDRTAIGTHILSNHVSCSALSEDRTPSILTPVYDIYQDPNPQEALKIRPLLQPVHERVNELLLQWPDHPSLKMINVVILRVLAFPLTSPLMRHVIGLETVLEKSQEWEKNAHSRVSLMDQLQPVTRQIIEWRKQELQAWRSCLDAVTQKVSLQGRKWWPNLFEMVQSGLEESISLEEIATTLKKLFETSLLGDFQTRLDLVYAFHCSLVVLDKCKIRDKLLALTWNFYHYYLQFLPQVTSSLAKARAPIEKDVKSYVKIARWNDINFFSVRESVVKSQKILHRHMRNWEKTLRSPISPVLCDNTTELSKDDTGAWDKEPDDEVHALIVPKMPKTPDKVECFMTLTDKIVLNRLSSFTSRSHDLTTQILSKNSYSSSIDSMEEFTSNLISNYQELQEAASKAENISDKEVRMQQLRNVMQRRRDSLAHLLKYLSTLGVSYTRGNSLWEDDDIDTCFGIKPVDVNVAHKNFPGCKEACKAWPGCVKYMNRCIARHSLLLTSLQQAHKDLGPQLIKRLHGTTCHLFLMSRNQRKSIALVNDHTRELSLMLADIKDAEFHPPSPSVMFSYWEQLHVLNTTLNIHVNEVNTILNTVNYYSSPLLVIKENPEVPDQMKLEEAKFLLEGIAKSLPAFVRKYSDYVKFFENSVRLVTPVFVKRLRGAIRKTSEDSEKIKEVISLLSVGNESELPVTEPLKKWVTEWELKKDELSAFVDKHVQEVKSDEQHIDYQVTKNVNTMESCLTCVLLAVENIYKRQHTQGDKKDEDEESSEKNMISKGMIENLECDMEDLRMKQVIKGLEKLLKESEKEPELLLMLKMTLPLLEQYLSLCESVLVFMVNSNRSLTKFTSILQAIFQQLALKGFCRPRELEEEETKGQGAMNFEDSDGTGLGEGEGKKDVSDRLESEDQLESALREGETEESGDKDLAEEEEGVEMSGDFEGKMQDVEKQEMDENKESDSEDEEEGEDHENQMGETEKGAEQLDKQIWGDDGEEEEDNDDELNEDDGDGDGEQTESKMVAKDDNKSKKEKDKERKEKEKLEEMEDTRQENTQADDGVEYDDNYTDPYAGEENDPNDEEEEEQMELDDEMVLDKNEGGGADEDEEGDPFDIPEMGVFPEEEREEKDKEDGEEEEENADNNESGQKEDKMDKDETSEKDGGDDDEDGGKKDEEDENEEESSEKKEDNRQVGIEEVNDDEEPQQEEETADASEDRESKSKEAEAAEMDTTEGSKDETKVCSCFYYFREGGFVVTFFVCVYLPFCYIFFISFSWKLITKVKSQII